MFHVNFCKIMTMIYKNVLEGKKLCSISIQNHLEVFSKFLLKRLVLYIYWKLFLNFVLIIALFALVGSS